MFLLIILDKFIIDNLGHTDEIRAFLLTDSRLEAAPVRKLPKEILSVNQSLETTSYPPAEYKEPRSCSSKHGLTSSTV